MFKKLFSISRGWNDAATQHLYPCSSCPCPWLGRSCRVFTLMPFNSVFISISLSLMFSSWAHSLPSSCLSAIWARSSFLVGCKKLFEALFLLPNGISSTLAVILWPCHSCLWQYWHWSRPPSMHHSTLHGCCRIVWRVVLDLRWQCFETSLEELQEHERQRRTQPLLDKNGYRLLNRPHSNPFPSHHRTIFWAINNMDPKHSICHWKQEFQLYHNTWNRTKKTGKRRKTCWEVATPSKSGSLDVAVTANSYIFPRSKWHN